MPTLYVENVPADLYAALRRHAKKQRVSIAAAVIELLAGNIPTEAELERRAALLERAIRIRRQPSPVAGDFPSAEEMVAEDRSR